MRHIIAVVVVILSLSLSGLVAAGPYEDEAAATAKGDYETSLRILRSLAAQGEARAQGDLAQRYNFGFLGVPQNYNLASEWYRRAADQGDSGAQHNLGIMYRDGRGVPQDYVLAHMWLNLAAAQGGGGAAITAEIRNLVAAKMTPAQVSEAQRLALEWKPRRH